MINPLWYYLIWISPCCQSALAFAPPHSSSSYVDRVRYVQSSQIIGKDMKHSNASSSNIKKSIERRTRSSINHDNTQITAQRTTVLLHANARINNLDEDDMELMDVDIVDDKAKEIVARKKSVRDEIFWAKQRALMVEMSARSDAEMKKENQDKFTKRRLALTSDTFYFSILIGCVLWLVSSNPYVTLSYLFGALSGTAYSYGLGKYVESIGGSIDDTDVEGAGVGQARFAFLILLFVVVGKFRSQGLLELPSIMGFFTYQLASLSQGLKEYDD